MTAAGNDRARSSVPKLAYRIEEVAEATSLSRATLYRLMESGQLEYRQVGGRRIVTAKQLDRFLDGLEVAV